jgi:hypothetical protein
MQVEVDEKTFARLQEWCEQESKSMSQVLAELVERHERDLFWRQMRTAYRRLQADRNAWREYQKETALLEGGSMDGMENEESYYSQNEEIEIRAYAKSQGW